MSGTKIKVDAETGRDRVSLDMGRARAELLFHDINRLLSLIDDEVGQGARLDPSDQAAYDRTNEVLAQLQREVGIEPQ